MLSSSVPLRYEEGESRGRRITVEKVRIRVGNGTFIERTWEERWLR